MRRLKHVEVRRAPAEKGEMRVMLRLLALEEGHLTSEKGWWLLQQGDSSRSFKSHQPEPATPDNRNICGVMEENACFRSKKGI